MITPRVRWGKWRVAVGAFAVVGLVVVLAFGLIPRLALDGPVSNRLGGSAVDRIENAAKPPEPAGFIEASIVVRNSGLVPVRVSNPHAVRVDDGAEARLSMEEAPAVRLAPDERANITVKLSLWACAEGSVSRVERGLHDVVLDVRSLGRTKRVTVDVDATATFETEQGTLPPCR